MVRDLDPLRGDLIILHGISKKYTEAIIQQSVVVKDHCEI